MQHEFTTTVCVVGLGYIGLPTAAMFASRGHRGHRRRRQRARGRHGQRAASPISSSRTSTCWSATPSRPASCAPSLTPQPADAFIIAVPTPLADDKRPDITYVDAAARIDRPGARSRATSSCWNRPRRSAPPSSLSRAARRRCGPTSTFPAHGDERADVLVAYCPERILPGQHAARAGRATTASSAA